MNKKNYLLADIGNSFTKIEIHTKSEIKSLTFKSLTQVGRFPAEHWNHIVKSYQIHQILFSSVIPQINSQIFSLPVSHSVTRVSAELILPFEMHYRSPLTLGSDRICLVAAASATADSESSSLIISAGTCITFDLLIGDKYIGGSISPGLQMRAKAMHHFTNALPEILPVALPLSEDKSVFIGQSTEECLLAGSVQGAAFEINEYINRLSQEYENLNIYLTGGDADTLEKMIKSDIFARPNMCLEGLNILYKLNA